MSVCVCMLGVCVGECSVLVHSVLVQSMYVDVCSVLWVWVHVCVCVCVCVCVHAHVCVCVVEVV